MKKRQSWINLGKAVVFMGIFVFLLLTVSYIVRPYSGSASRKNICGFYAEKDNSIDIAFVGSSVIFAYWEPMEFWKDHQITSYDFAVGGMPAQTIKYAVKEVRKTQDPKLYVIDLRLFGYAEYKDKKGIMSMNDEVYLRNLIDNMKYSPNRFDVIRTGVPDDYDKMTYYLDIMKYHSEWMSLFDKQSIAYADNEDHDPTKGYKIVDDIKPLDYADQSGVTTTQPVGQLTEDILRDLLQYCKDEGLEVMFLLNPYSQNKETQEKHNYMAGVIEEYGYNCLNTNYYFREMGLDFQTDYYDKQHTNLLGADKYTKFVGDYILDHYPQLLEISHSEECIKEWDADYEIWNEEAGKVRESLRSKIQRAE